MSTRRTLERIDSENLRTDLPDFRPGDKLRVLMKVVEGEKERIQSFEGRVIRKTGGGIRSTFTLRKVSYAVGVEKTFPLHSPLITEIEVLERGKVRRARLYYLRKRVGKAARVKRRERKREEMKVGVKAVNETPSEDIEDVEEEETESSG